MSEDKELRGHHGVDLHPKLIHLKRVLASKFDPRVDPILPINRAGGQRSDRRGDIECDQTLACTRGRIDSRDQQAEETVAQYDREVLGERRSGGGLSEAQEPEQTGRLGRVAGVMAEAGIGAGSQGAA